MIDQCYKKRTLLALLLLPVPRLASTVAFSVEEARWFRAVAPLEDVRLNEEVGEEEDEGDAVGDHAVVESPRKVAVLSHVDRSVNDDADELRLKSTRALCTCTCARTFELTGI